MHASQAAEPESGAPGLMPASLAGQENAASPPGPAWHMLASMPPELEPELLPASLLPELEPELLPELEPLELLEVSSPASAPPLLLLAPADEEEEHAFVPIVPIPPIINRHAQKASFFIVVTNLPV